MVIDKFHLEWTSTCKNNDYFFVNPVKKYTKVNKPNNKVLEAAPLSLKLLWKCVMCKGVLEG